jgi:hypothetical protein
VFFSVGSVGIKKARIKMKRFSTAAKCVLMGVIPLFLSGCLCVEVIDNVRNPGRYFQEAYREIDRIHRHHRRGGDRAEQLHILVYEKDERKIVKIETPVWMADTCTDLDEWIERGRDEFDLEIRYDFSRRKFRNLKLKRPGLLAEFKDRGDRVLIWLE